MEKKAKNEEKTCCFSKLYNIYRFLSAKSTNNNRPIYIYMWYFTLLCIFGVIFFLNYKTLLIGDDYVYSYIYQTNEKLRTINDIIESQHLHYMIWGGRSIVHFIAQALLLIKTPWIIDLINSIAFIVFILSVYFLITGKKIYSISLLLIIFGLTWFLQPSFAETILWVTGSANYLWGTLIILLYIVPFRLYKGTDSSTIKKLATAFFMFAAGILAGWTNENTAAALLAIIILFIVFFKKQKFTIPIWALTGLIGVFIGFFIMIMAPGNFARAEEASISPFLVCYRILTYSQRFIYYLGLLNLGTIISLILLFQFSDKNTLKQIAPYFLIFIAATLISIYSMVVSPSFPPRAWFGVITFNIIAFGLIFHNLNFDLSFLTKIKYSIILFGFLGFGFTLYDAAGDVIEIDNIWKKRMAELKTKKEEGAKYIVFPEYQAKTKFGLGDTPYAKKYISIYYDIEFDIRKE